MTHPAISKHVRLLTCAHCGSGCVGRQWHNRDKGTGVCRSCVKYIRAKGEASPFEQRRMWGEEGVHFAVDPSSVPAHLKDCDE